MSTGAQYLVPLYNSLGWTCFYCKAWVTPGETHVCPMYRLEPATGDAGYYRGDVILQEQFIAKSMTYHITCPHCKKVIEIMVKETG